MTIKVTPELVADIKALLQKRQPIPYDAVLKWNRNQPRGPRGTKEGGRWVKALSAGLGSQPGWGMQSTVPGMERTMGQANYNDILNAPSGTGFKNTPQVKGSQAQAMLTRMNQEEKDRVEAERQARGTGSKKITVLKEGSVESSHPLGGGTNTTLTVEFDDGTKAIFKPEGGENWGHGFANYDIEEYIRNTDLSLAEREAMAFEIGDALFKEDNPVPETVHRTSVDGVDIDDVLSGSGDDYDEGGGGYDSDYARSRYESYREKAYDDVMDAVGDEMYGLYKEAKQEHADEIGKRAEELNEIWNEEVENFAANPAGTRSALIEHPVLPLGSKGPFERKPDLGVLDPLEVLDEANVDVEYPLNTEERERVTAIIRKRLEEGYSEFGDVDEEKAGEHLDYDDWRQNHEDTEGRLLESKIKTFTEWRKSAGFHSDEGGGGGGGGVKNPDAPHPQGGSLQLWQEDFESYGWGGSGSFSEADGARMAVLDYVIGSMDRHGSNIGFVEGRPKAIDNGYSLPAADDVDNFRFRSVAVADWKAEGHSMNIPETIRNPILEQLRKTDWQALVDRHPSMNEAERTALLGRIAKVTTALETPDGLYNLWKKLDLMR